MTGEIWVKAIATWLYIFKEKEIMSRLPFILVVLIIPVLSVISEVVSPDDAGLENSVTVSRLEHHAGGAAITAHEGVEGSGVSL